jgi:hypothetical protein
MKVVSKLRVRNRFEIYEPVSQGTTLARPVGNKVTSGEGKGANTREREGIPQPGQKGGGGGEGHASLRAKETTLIRSPRGPSGKITGLKKMRVDGGKTIRKGNIWGRNGVNNM